jgi:TonB-linked SusC/RagA family outer membrane protein
MKCSPQRIAPLAACVSSGHWQKRRIVLFALFLFSFFSTVSAQENVPLTITGFVKDSSGNALANTTVAEKGTKNATTSNGDGMFSLKVAGKKSVLVFTSVGFAQQQVTVANQSAINVSMTRVKNDLDEVVVIGYGSRKKESLTGAISSITAKDLDRVHGGSTVSSGLAGKIAGVTFRMPDGRPGAGANIQIRNMGDPLYVIDGIQQDAGQFNNLAPNDVESITVLKDGSAAIYGVRAANGVVLVTTKRGRVNQPTRVNIDAYTGGQSWTRFPSVLNNSYDYMRYKADAEVTSFGHTDITPAELDKFKAGTEDGYKSFDWTKFIVKNNAPQTSLNANLTGGSDKVNYYISATNLKQNSVLGREYKFARTNIQSNLTAQVTKRLKVGVQINGRTETKENPGVPGGDDYFLAKYAILRNTPLDRPYANDNPAYLQDNGNHTEANWAYLNYKIAGKYKSDWRVLQTNVDAEYQIPGVKGLTARGVYSYYIADYLLNNHEYTYDAYTYRPASKVYERTNGSSNPWREREQIKQINTTVQGQLNYNNKFGQHTVGATFVAERLQTRRLRNWIHASPTTNALPLIYFATADTYQDSDDKTARVGYVGRINYNFEDKYYFEASGRRDASYLFPPDHRIGYFPSVSAGWRITKESFMKKLLGEKSVLTDLKFRGSYGILGDDRNPYDNNQTLVPEFAYLEGYDYNRGTAIFGGNAVVGSRDRGVPVTNITWLKSKITDIGIDYTLFGNHLTGTFDYFYRKRTGIPATKSDVILPLEIGYGLPSENLNSDAQFGGEMSLNYTGTINKFNFSIGGNLGYTRGKNLDSYKPRFSNSWDQYRNSGENRYRNIEWGYEVEGQFTSQEQINNFKTNIDGRGNSTLLPGDLIYKDQNSDGKINQYDERPISFGYGTQPNINFGFNLAINYSNFDFHADFSGASGYTWYQNWETRWAFQNQGNLNTIFTDRWHRTDPYDVNSAWIPGKYPTNRFNPGHDHSNYGGPGGSQWNSTFWLHNVTYVKLRTIELGYTLPVGLLSRVKIQGVRFYINAYNLLSFDNLKSYGVDPEVTDDNGLQFPQNKFINAGIHIAL